MHASTRTNLSDNAIKFLSKDPTHIGTVGEFDFFEHPTQGDEAPLMVIGPDGKVRRSDWYDLPTVEDLVG